MVSSGGGGSKKVVDGWRKKWVSGWGFMHGFNIMLVACEYVASSFEWQLLQLELMEGGIWHIQNYEF